MATKVAAQTKMETEIRVPRETTLSNDSEESLADIAAEVESWKFRIMANQTFVPQTGSATGSR